MQGIKILFLIILALPAIQSIQAQHHIKKGIPMDSILLSDPCILADQQTSMYYMTGTGGMLWKSKDLKLWEGPYAIAQTDPHSWMGPKPMIWAAELHPYQNKYYYLFNVRTNLFLILELIPYFSSYNVLKYFSTSKYPS